MPSIRTNAVNAAAAAAAVAAAAGGTGAGQSSGHSTPSGNASSVGAIAALANNLQNMGMKERPPVAERPDRPERPERLPTSVSSTISVTLTNTSSAAAAAAAAAHNDGSNDSNKLNTGNESSSSAVTKGEAPGLPKTNPRFREIAGYVGFANLPNQVYRKAVKRGFEFTLMVVGASGLGKSTLINSMFLTDIYDAEKYPGPSHRLKKTVTVDATKVLLKENGVNLTLTVVDTPGFGDSVDNSNCWVPILEFVDNKYEDYLTAESRVKRTPFPDNRVHCCLYFIAPTGHGLRPLDIACMQCLSDKVNIIPVIAKADTMTPDEVQLFKKQILNEIAQNKIKIYDFPKTLEESEEDDKEGKASANSSHKLRSHIPFAVVGANTIIEVDGKKVRGRRYPWGIVEVENLQHCDFIALRNMVIRTHLQDLKEVTNDVHYENFRCKKLSGLGLVDGKARLNNKNPLTQMEEEKREHELKMKKMEAEMEQVFDMKVREKQQKLKDSEMELARRHEERKKALDVQVKELEEQWLAFEKEKREWEELHHVTLEELKRRSLGAHNSSDTIDSKKEKKKKGLF